MKRRPATDPKHTEEKKDQPVTFILDESRRVIRGALNIQKMKEWEGRAIHRALSPGMRQHGPKNKGLEKISPGL